MILGAPCLRERPARLFKGYNCLHCWYLYTRCENSSYIGHRTLGRPDGSLGKWGGLTDHQALEGERNHQVFWRARRGLLLTRSWLSSFRSE